MTAPDTPALAGMSIGAVLDLLRPDFPDVTISKIRFLEAEGLVTPERTASGYRRFTAYDCARLRFILTAQRDQYLPLKVIKAAAGRPARRRAAADADPPTAYRVWCRCPMTHRADGDAARRLGAWRRPRCGCRREDLLTRSGVDEDLLTALIKAGVITHRAGRLLRRAFGGDRRSAPARWRTTASSRGTCGRSARRPTASPT